MASAREAREWAASGGLHGIGDSLYTPFRGLDGDHIDWEAYRRLVRYCVGDLRHAMLWLTSGVGEWWSLTMDERKRLLEVAIEEAHAVDPGTVIQACTSAPSAKDALDLTLHAQAAGADICYLQTPPMEVHAGEGVLRFFQYVADRTDIALGMFNSPSSGYVPTAPEMAEIYHRIPAVVAVKEGVQDSLSRSAAVHALAPALVVWECDLIVYRAGWLQEGIVGPAQLGTSGYLFEAPDRLWYTQYWQLIWDGQLPTPSPSPGNPASTPTRLRWATGLRRTRAGRTISRIGAKPLNMRRLLWACQSAISPTRDHPRASFPNRGRRSCAPPSKTPDWLAKPWLPPSEAGAAYGDWRPTDEGRVAVRSQLTVSEPASLDPGEARARLLLTLWLAAALTRGGKVTSPSTPVPSPRSRPEAGSGSRTRRRSPVRPPRAC